MYCHVSATNPVSARLIGAIFLERGLVTEEQLQAALAVQVETKEHLGEILVQHFGVSRIELASVLAEQWADLERANAGATPPESEKPTLQIVPTTAEVSAAAAEEAEQSGEGEPRRPLGEIFVERGLVTDAELDRALEIQKEGGEKLGEILVAQGSITRLQLASALAEQWTALRKIRPPSSTEGVPTPAAAAVPRDVVPSAEVERLHEAVSALEQRVRAAESIGAREPWREEITSATEGLQSTITELESRLADAATRDEVSSLEELRTRVQELSNRLEEKAASERIQDADLTRRVESAAEAAEAAKSSLGGALESMSLRLADVESRVHDRSEVTDLLQQLEALGASVAELGGEVSGFETDELRNEVKRLADEVNRLGAGPREADPKLVARVDALAERVDDVARAKGDHSAVERELAALAKRLETLEGSGSEIAEIRGSLAELHARPPVDSVLAERLSHYGAAPDQLAELRGRLDQLEQRNDELAEQSPALDERLGSLAGRIEELAARPVGDPDLADRVERIASRLESASTAEHVAELRAQVDELAARPQAEPGLSERIERVANRLDVTPSSEQLDELRSRLDDLSSRVAAPPEGVAELRAQVESFALRPEGDPALAEKLEELAARFEQAASAEQLQDLHTRLDDLSSSVAAPTEGLDELRSQVETLASRPVGDPTLAESLEQLSARLEAAPSHEQLHELRARLDDLSSRPAGDPELAKRVERLADRLDELASQPGDDPALADKLEELATRLQTAPSQEQLQKLRKRIDDLSSRPAGDPALPEQIERLANRLDELSSRPAGDPGLGDRLDVLSSRLEELAARVDAPAKDISELNARVEDIASRPGGDPALAKQVEKLERRLGDLSERTSASPSPELFDELSKRLDQMSDRLQKLPKLRDRIDELSGRAWVTPEDVAELRSRVEELASSTQSADSSEGELASLADELRRSVERLGARVDAVEELASDRSAAADLEPRLDALEGKVAETAEHGAATAESLQYMTERVSAVDELRARLDEVVERVAERESAEHSAQRKTVKKSDLATLREELEGRVEALVGRFDSLATEAESAQSSLRDKVDSVAESVREAAKTHQAELDERVTSAESDAATLRERLTQLEQMHAAADAAEAERKDAVADVDRRLEELATQLAEQVSEPQPDAGPALDELRAELASLVDRLERSDATTAERLAKLTSDLEAVAQSGIDLLAHVEREATGETSDLVDRVGSLERRVDADAALADEQVRATEEALRDGLAALGGRLAETESSYVEAGDALRRSIERLGAAIVEADSVAGSRAHSPVVAPPEPEQDASGPFLAFVPNDGGYALQEIDAAVPAVGSALSVPDEADDLVVTRVGRSPLPLDRRRCVYLERRTMPPTAADRVP